MMTKGKKKKNQQQNQNTKTPANIQTHFCLFIHEGREANNLQRGRHIGNKGFITCQCFSTVYKT